MARRSSTSVLLAKRMLTSTCQRHRPRDVLLSHQHTGTGRLALWQLASAWHLAHMGDSLTDFSYRVGGGRGVPRKCKSGQSRVIEWKAADPLLLDCVS